MTQQEIYNQIRPLLAGAHEEMTRLHDLAESLILGWYYRRRLNKTQQKVQDLERLSSGLLHGVSQDIRKGSLLLLPVYQRNEKVYQTLLAALEMVNNQPVPPLTPIQSNPQQV